MRSLLLRKVPYFQGILVTTMPRPGVEPGLKMRTKQNQIHQRKVNSFAELREIEFVAFCSLSPRFSANSAQVLPKDFRGCLTSNRTSSALSWERIRKVMHI